MLYVLDAFDPLGFYCVDSTICSIMICAQQAGKLNMFQGQKPWTAVRLPEVPLKLQKKSSCHCFMRAQDSSLMQGSLNIM